MSVPVTGWDAGNVYHAGVHASKTPSDSRVVIEQKLFKFVDQFRMEEHFIYREKIKRNAEGRNYSLAVQLEHLDGVDRALSDKLKTCPADFLPLFEVAVQNLAKQLLQDDKIPTFQILLRSNETIQDLRKLNSEHISQLVRVSGIIIAATNLSAKATNIQIMCKTCRQCKMLPVPGGFSGIQLPRACDSDPTEIGPKDCGLDPYVVIHDKCTFVDQQVLKLQESPELLPVGDLPRHITVHVDRYLTNKVIPGRRVTITGIYDICQNSSSKKQSHGVGTRIPYIRAIGLELDTEQVGQELGSFTHAEEEEIIAISRRPNFYNVFTNSIAPSIFGNRDIKHAIASLLFGGSKKILADGMKLRGDINVLLLGDPGTAKSQFLKFVHQVAPVAVYTSGKGSSAAGLTAAVVRDAATREFRLEGGAMVLADGGVICIDEFDKMRDEDRVAIHEAMEQQTISIAKAGITTILNSRTSVLAAANPIFGRYDDMKTPGENIDFQTTILSRFDMIFIVKDEHNDARDRDIARHVLGVHMHRAPPESAVGEIDITKMKKYIAYARLKCAPRLSSEAAEKLSSHFVAIRSEVKNMEQQSNVRSSIPITVRQLEAIVRISESLAKMTLSPRVTEQHVDEAIRLFKHSTMDALQSGEVEGMSQAEVARQLKVVEKEIKSRIPMGSRASTQRIIKELEKNFSAIVVGRAIDILVRREVLQYRNQRKVIFRSGV
ncbi:MCM2/3/5 family-domain-containing protein [Gigaspora rosea]|uniref:DNA replication licensing factor MCM5 n=1 Tax=Gigaspora rosea TaxID=44941 RepID=A0A397V3F7_9GLOM|nr:MCM2/3/5 family-domain-containing protein [Gigaspora rosea]